MQPKLLINSVINFQMLGKILNNIFGDVEISKTSDSMSFDSKLSDTTSEDNSISEKMEKIQSLHPIRASFRGIKDVEYQFKFESPSSNLILKLNLEIILVSQDRNSIHEIKSAIILGTSAIRNTNINGSSKRDLNDSNSAKLAKKELNYNDDKYIKNMNKEDNESLLLSDIGRSKKDILKIENNSLKEYASNSNKTLTNQQDQFTPKLKSVILCTHVNKYTLFRRLIFNPNISKKTLDGHINNAKLGVKYSLTLKLPSAHSLKSKEIILSTPEKGFVLG